MAYDEDMAARVRKAVSARGAGEERKMFGGLGWMVGGNMACAVMSTGGLIVRLDPDEVPDALRRAHVREFGREGAKPMRGFVLVEPAGLVEDDDLGRWVEAGVARASSLPPK